jgi:hypothetical protein
MARWELGSEFHFVSPMETGEHSTWPSHAAYYGSGRDAMRSILLHGQRQYGWKRLWVPLYFCQDVVSALHSTGLEVCFYSDGPIDSTPQLDQASLCKGDIVLLMNFFGLRCTAAPVQELQALGAGVLEDHSHDPWSLWARHSTADWCVASLRKTLPLPDGGILWSPQGHELPSLPPVTEHRQRASLHKLAAMALKTLYLASDYDDKQQYRALAIAGEKEIAEGQISAMPQHSQALLGTFPVLNWRIRRQENVAELYRAMHQIGWLDCLGKNSDAGICPFGGILLVNSEERRNHIRVQLINAGVYPAILWPLENLPLTATTLPYIDFSRRMFMIHCDMRYGPEDMQRVASLICRFGEEA